MALFTACILLTLGLVVFAFPAGVYALFFTSLSSTYSAASIVPNLILFIGPAYAVMPLGVSVGAVFLALIAVYLAMVLVASVQGKPIHRAIGDAFASGFDSLFSNRLLVTVMAIGFLAFTIEAVDALETAAGVPVGSLPATDAVDMLLALTLAPLREEFGFRVLFLGVVALIMSYGLPIKKALGALWRPSTLYESRDDALTHSVMVVVLGLSSLAFGIVHVTSGAGWDIGKLPEAAYAGVVLGYLYIRYGFHVAVLTHWGIDYLGSVYSFFGQGVAGISYAGTATFWLQALVNVDLLWLVGLASFLVVFYKVTIRVMDYIRARNPPPSSL